MENSKPVIKKWIKAPRDVAHRITQDILVLTICYSLPCGNITHSSLQSKYAHLFLFNKKNLNIPYISQNNACNYMAFSQPLPSIYVHRTIEVSLSVCTWTLISTGGSNLSSALTNEDVFEAMHIDRSEQWEITGYILHVPRRESPRRSDLNQSWCIASKR